MAAKRIPHWKGTLWGTAAFAVWLWIAWSLHIPCLFQALFRVPCPGCGMTRAWLSVCRGDFAAAFSFHPLFWTVPLLYGYILTDGALLNRKWADRLILALVLAAYGLLGLGRIFIPAWRLL